MPLYEYICRQCGGTFEKMVRFSEADLSPVCPSCASSDTQKKVSVAAAFGSSSSSGGGAGSSGFASSCGSRGGFG
ncbi:MAG TPA: zinc ribbon domain-containing protein [Anaerolineaceae bacterium]|jgi:putative FmdB family regulatory protein|nr:zinc ribbon domain-containing protein [Anaerolineaceae bacterium]